MKGLILSLQPGDFQERGLGCDAFGQPAVDGFVVHAVLGCGLGDRDAVLADTLQYLLFDLLAYWGFRHSIISFLFYSIPQNECLRFGVPVTFVRLIYNGRIPGYIKNWYTDYPKGDQALVAMLGRSTGAQIAEEPRAIPILHPDLFNYPMVYSLEAGQMLLDDPQRKRMREYLERGGFWMIDDFWGTHEWDNFESEMR